MAGYKKHTVEQIVKVLRKTKGMIYLAAQMLRCNPQTIYNRAKETPAIQQAIKEERGKMVDTAEQKLFAAIKKGEGWAIMAVLRMLGKDRGYVDPAKEVNVNSKVTIPWNEMAKRLPKGRPVDVVEEELQKRIAAMPGATLTVIPATNGETNGDGEGHT